MNHKFSTKPSKKILSSALAFVMLYNCFFPTVAFALTGGPSQPEVQSFQPIATSDMVDLFSGDFKYNVPLMDIEGYPINLIYSSNVTMDQEASWVGLGWNLNPGVVNRGIRGIPDDFKGDPISKSFNIKPNKTIGLNVGAAYELFGNDKINVSLQYTLGLKWNNYNGFGASQTFNFALSGGEENKGPLSGGIGLSSSADEGLTISPHVSLSGKVAESEKTTTSASLNVGCSYNSRGGLKNLTIDANLNVSQKEPPKPEPAATSTTDPVSSTEPSAEKQEAAADHEKSTPLQISQGAKGQFDFTASTYSPQITMPMKNLTVGGNFKLGGELFGVFPNGFIGGYYSEQRLATHHVSNPGFGYLYSQYGKSGSAIHDFNREKDGSYNAHTPGLPLANYTSDVFSVSGQGVGGSYRAFRGDVGTVYDAEAGSTADSWDIGFDLGTGNTGHMGVDVNLQITNTTSGRWSDGNRASKALAFRNKGDDDLYEPAYFKEANEKTVDSDPGLYNNLGSNKAAAIALNKVADYNVRADAAYVTNDDWTPHQIIKNYRAKRELRNQNFSYLTHKEIENYGLQHYQNLYPAPDHHIAEITTLGNDGKRYVYGLAAYNTSQTERTFAADEANTLTNEGNVSFQDDDITTGNKNGTDNYYSETNTPPFAYAYMLTAVLSPDYIDCDNEKGPSANDYGTWVKFDYEKIYDDYQWRTPYAPSGYAAMNYGSLSDNKDNKGNIIYGKKEIYYLKKIESKNYIAYFELTPRDDSQEAASIKGGTGTRGMQKLDVIMLFNKKDMVVPIKVVRFRYAQPANELCQGVTNNATGHGKLTLDQLFISYGNSHKGEFSPYVFHYAGSREHYKAKCIDRWGNFKSDNSQVGVDPPVSVAGEPPLGMRSPNSHPQLTHSEFPYSDQDKTRADLSSYTWSLTSIDLPSGGKIKMDYESDDYAYVQNKQAMQMFQLQGTYDLPNNTIIPGEQGFGSLDPASELKFVFKKYPNTAWYDYVSLEDLVYFKSLVNISGGIYEYIPGYGKIEDAQDIPGTDFAWIQFYASHVKDNQTSASINPIALAGVQFTRMNMPKVAFSNLGTPPADADISYDILNQIIGAGFITSMMQAAVGLNTYLYDINHIANNIVINHSWVRLKCPFTHKKLGGGSRVRQLIMVDNWNTITGTENTHAIGQQYKYTINQNVGNHVEEWSSGVASYEPQLGGDENPWKQPVFYDSERKTLAPDDRFYMEEPFGETFFPSPSVGYSQVTVANVAFELDPNTQDLVQIQNLKRHGTGKTVHEFYTAKDFPTITDRTIIQKYEDKPDPISLTSLFNFYTRDFMTVSQGYSVELNDMHGKPKTVTIYPEELDPAVLALAGKAYISKTTYKYMSVPYGPDARKLVNENLTLINPDGTFVPAENATIGVFRDVTYDSREETMHTMAPSLGVNSDFFYIPPFFLPFIPMIWPGWSEQKTQFRSGVLTKVIQRFGILEETTVEDVGSIVSTKNIAYDSQTGEPLVTQTITNFNDYKYSMNFPAYWYYQDMGLASSNIGVAKYNLYFTTGSVNIPNADKYFVPGDEIEINAPQTAPRAWITTVTPTSINAVYKNGSPVSGQANSIKVIRSGKRNVQSNLMATITTLTNPLEGFAGNTFDQILKASAIEYKNGWRTYCDCPGVEFPLVPYSSNPYINGSRGTWKPSKTYAYLTGRTLTDFNGNTNIRRDGVFTSYDPLYKHSGGKWTRNPQGWTFATEVTEFDPYAQEIENRDALKRSSAATFGYNQSLATSVSNNSRYRDVGVDNFEDYGFNNCADNHFRFTDVNGLTFSNTESHTGRYSILVNDQTSQTQLKRQLQTTCVNDPCEIFGYSITPNSGGTGVDISIDNGTAGVPFTFSWTITSGTPGIFVDATGRALHVTWGNFGTPNIVVTVTDPTTTCTRTFTVPPQ